MEKRGKKSSKESKYSFQDSLGCLQSVKRPLEVGEPEKKGKGKKKGF
jgi:hypothetical protein